MKHSLLTILLVLICHSLVAEDFPPELTQFRAFAKNPVFTGQEGAWDPHIRERGWILHENGIYKMWYTGYRNKQNGLRMLGYATSQDGVAWKRHPANPLDQEHWIEDMMVMPDGDGYYMVAEGKQDIAHAFSSADGIRWKRLGPLDIRMTNGEPIAEGPRGTPTLWKEDGVWYLFYERGDQGVWIATSVDRKVWTNIKDDPVIAKGPDKYDQYAVACNQVIKYQGKYYAYYHGSDSRDWKEWNTNVAMSDDLIHWQKYPKNPIQRENKSSGIVVQVGNKIRLYTMHAQVQLHLPMDSEN